MTTDDRHTRDQLLDAALRLFAERGYAATSIAEIQRECGLSPGSGALYKHFDSKNALLRAAMRRQLDRLTAAREAQDAVADTGQSGAMARIPVAIWDGIVGNADLFRVMFREPDAIDDFADEVFSGVIADVYQKFGESMRAAAAEGPAEVEDPEATSAVLIAALAYLPVVKILIGRTPGDIEPARFHDAWVRLSRAAFRGTVPR